MREENPRADVRLDDRMNAAKAGMARWRIVALAVLLALTALVGAGLGVLVYYPQQVAEMLRPLIATEETEDSTGLGEELASEDSAETEGDGETEEAVQEAVAQTAADKEAAERYNGIGDVLPTRQVAALADIPIYSPIAQNRLTGVLFHQASYETALVMTTQLPEASLEGLDEEHPVRVNNAQAEGDWVDADALHMYREVDATEMDTAIDVGAHWGSVVYAPVSGTVVLVEDYDLYGYVPDIKIHIQPDGHPELDVVLLHQYEPLVKAGDKVQGGVTPLSHVRDIAKDLTDVQLGFCTPVGDPGNHSHVQVNNADYPGYREDSLKNAYKVK